MRYILSLGTNVTDGVLRLQDALIRLTEFGKVVKQSSIYTTPSIGGKGPDYFNAVAEVESGLELNTLNNRLKQMEKDAGRTPEDKLKGMVPLDIDIVVADGKIVRPADYGRSYFTIGYGQLLD